MWLFRGIRRRSLLVTCFQYCLWSFYFMTEFLMLRLPTISTVFSKVSWRLLIYYKYYKSVHVLTHLQQTSMNTNYLSIKLTALFLQWELLQILYNFLITKVIRLIIRLTFRIPQVTPFGELLDWSIPLRE